LALGPASAMASSQTWTINDPSGAATTSVAADNDCDVPGGPPSQCTISEAVFEANHPDNPADTDTIHFNLPATTTLALGASVSLSLNQPMTIDGCSGAAATAPCVGINGGAVLSSPIVADADGITIEGLAIGFGGPEEIFAPGGVGALT